MFERVLLVDDNEDTARYARAVLERQGYDVTVAQSGREALDRAGMSRPDLVLLDLLMPGLDGFAVLQSLKSNRRLRAVPVVVFSAKRARDDVARAIEQGAADYVAKPVTADGLVAKVRNVLLRLREDEPTGETPIGAAERAWESTQDGHAAVTIRGELLSADGAEARFFSALHFEPGQVVRVSPALLGPHGIEAPVMRIVSRTPETHDGRPGYLYVVEPFAAPLEDGVSHGHGSAD